MPEAVRLPIRVLVKGASEVVLTSEIGGPRTDFALGRVLEAGLLSAGQPAEVRVNAVPSDLARMALRSWEREVLGWSPDVVILHYGHYESIHLFLPRWLERHANSKRSRPGRIRTFYRRTVLRAIWIGLAKLQARSDAALDSTMLGWRLRRVAADVERLITHIQTVGSPLVLVMEILPPGRRWQAWMPGLAERTAVMNEHFASMVRGIDKPNVRIFSVSNVLADQLADEEPKPDGGHYSVTVHRLIGEALCREIMNWAATQGHLESWNRAREHGAET
ncbi:MAG: hypothetical protein DLM57_02720 [Pseudonocardiales bacterium]|nr:MAG: hypothetical protein DLM57_02720 [Pseudonocardiales bacterium]